MHWTYASLKDKDSDLEQGDILDPTAELQKVLSEVHPHFCDKKYLGFVIATQSCDLVRRKGGIPSARYISIATVRSLTEVMPSLLADEIGEVASGLFNEKVKFKAKQLLERLFDQNEQRLGLFYLHPDGEIGLGESAVGYLRVKVALHAEHYPVLVRARRGCLDPAFRAKFGWLLGNLYSRPASPDWSDADTASGKKQKNDLVEKYLREQIAGVGPIWVPDELIEAGEEAGITFKGRDHSGILAALESVRPKPRLERIVEQVMTEVDQIVSPSEDKRQLLRSTLLNSTAFKTLVARSR